MNVAIDKVLYHLTGNGDINTVTVAELERVTTEHPYFSVGQLLLAHKHNLTNNPDFLPQVQRTSLYIPNSSWLQYQLQTEEPEVKLPIPVEEETKPLLNKVVEEENKIHIPSVERVKEIMNGIDSKPLVVAVTPEPEEKIEEPVEIPEPIVEEVANDVKEDIVAEEPIAEERKQAPIIAIAQPKEESKEIETAVEEPVINKAPEEISVAEEIVAKEEEQPTNPIPVIEELLRLEPQPITPEADCDDDDYPQTTEEVAVQIEMGEKQRSSIASMLDEQVAEFKKPVTAETLLPIDTEPYHTVDYFASQGIKLNLDLKSQDKLSNQLRKFTDWLKHMKSIPPNADDLGSDPELEGAINNIANTSNEAKEIVTETMAEVLVKQGKIEKAIQLYIKLSFLNPDKSAYFAAKIQELKGI